MVNVAAPKIQEVAEVLELFVVDISHSRPSQEKRMFLMSSGPTSALNRLWCGHANPHDMTYFLNPAALCPPRTMSAFFVKFTLWTNELSVPHVPMMSDVKSQHHRKMTWSYTCPLNEALSSQTAVQPRPTSLVCAMVAVCCGTEASRTRLGQRAGEHPPRAPLPVRVAS